MAVVSKTTAKVIRKGNTNKSSILSRNNEFRIVDGINQVYRSKAVERVIIQAETIPVLCAVIVIDNRDSFDVIVIGSRVFENCALSNLFKGE